MWLFQVAWLGAKHGRFRIVFYGRRLKFPSVTAPANKVIVALMTKPWKTQSLTPTMLFGQVVLNPSRLKERREVVRSH